MNATMSTNVRWLAPPKQAFRTQQALAKSTSTFEPALLRREVSTILLSRVLGCEPLSRSTFLAASTLLIITIVLAIVSSHLVTTADFRYFRKGEEPRELTYKRRIGEVVFTAIFAIFATAAFALLVLHTWNNAQCAAPLIGSEYSLTHYAALLMPLLGVNCYGWVLFVRALSIWRYGRPRGEEKLA